MPNYIPGLDILGKGYDVFGRFAHPSGVYNVRLFEDFTQLADEEADPESATYLANIQQNDYLVPDFVSLVEENTAEANYIQGSSISNFQSELDIKVSAKGKYSFYSGEAKFGFSSSQQSNHELYYTRFSNLSKAYRLALPGNEQLRGILDPSFADDLQNGANTPEAIDAFFNTYGSHFLAEVVLGGCLNYYATVEKSAVSSDMEIKASVKASYNSLTTSASVSVDSSYYSSKSVEATHSETGIETVGGNISKAGVMLTDQKVYEELLASIMQDPALVDFTSQSLRPIWELLDTESQDRAIQDRIAALETRFNEISGQSTAINTQGTAKHGDAIYPPWGEKDDWVLFISPARLGFTEESDDKDVDNAILQFEYGIDDYFDFPDHWQVKAKYRFRTAIDKNQMRWHTDGLVNYVLLPKKSYIYLSPESLGYDIYDDKAGELWKTEADGSNTLVYTFNEDDNRLLDPDGEVVLKKIFYQGGSFYQYRTVAAVKHYQAYGTLLEAPGGGELNDWNMLFSPAAVDYTEDSNDDKDKDNALIRWNWSTPRSLYTDFADVSVDENGEPYYPVEFSSTMRYRKGYSDADHVINIGADYHLLYVHKDFSHWTGAGGNQALRLPDNDLKADNWILAITPSRMGNHDEEEKSDQKNSSLLQTKCTASRSDTKWTVNSSYLWSGNHNHADQVAWEPGQAECLFITSAVLENTSLD